MRIACVRVPYFTVAIERERDPALGELPLIVLDRNAVLDASPGLGVQPGLPLRQAKAIQPDAVFVEADRARYRAVFESMLSALELTAPLVTPAEPGCAYAQTQGLEGHYADGFALAGALVEAVRESTGLLAGAGIASSAFVAGVAAAMSPPGDAGVVATGREREFLADKPASLLPVGVDVLRQLDLLALHTLGDIAALPQTAVEAQFRRTGRRMWELANGIDSAPLRPRKPEKLLHERISFETGVVSTEALATAGLQLIGRLARKLRGRTARRMHVQLLTDERITWERLEVFREPTGDEQRMLLLLRTRLSLLELPRAVDAIVITLSGIGREVAKQTKLFTETSQNLDQIAESIRQLRARYGRPVVWRIVEVDPWSRHPEERTALLPYDA